MSDDSGLERRYRRLLALYPAAFREEHEEEMLTVLINGAAAGQRRPRLAEAADLLRNATFMRLRKTQPRAFAARQRMMMRWAYRHRHVMIPIRVALGIWIAVVTAVLYGSGRGGWWAAVLVPAELLNLYLLYRLRRPLES